MMRDTGPALASRHVEIELLVASITTSPIGYGSARPITISFLIRHATLGWTIPIQLRHTKQWFQTF